MKKKAVKQKREENSFLSSKNIKDFRKGLNLTQYEAGLIFGGGPVAFSKYERDETCQSKSLDILMKLILKNKINLSDITSLY